MFQLNRNKQKTHPNSLKDSKYIWVFFRKFRVVSVCHQTVLFVSVVLIWVRNTETNRNFLFLVSQNKRETDLVRFVSNRNLFLFVSRTPYLLYLSTQNKLISQKMWTSEDTE
jgi:hypothetical protein